MFDYGEYYYVSFDEDDNNDDYNDYDNFTSRYTSLFYAVHEGDLNRFNAMLVGSDLEETILGRTMMHVAAARGQTRIAEILIRNGANVNAKDSENKTPLLLALARSHVELAELLLENGADVDEFDGQGKTPLYLATEIRNVHLVDIILKKGAKVNVLEEDSYTTPIEKAAELNDIQIVELLLKHGAKVDQIDPLYEGQEPCPGPTTPLHHAAQNGNVEMAELLMKNGFDTINAHTFESETPLIFAVTNHHLDFIKYLVEKGVEIELETEDDYNLLHLCKTNEHIEIVKYLIDIGMRYQDNATSGSLLYLSLAAGQLELWKYLSTCRSKMYEKLCDSETELHRAVRAGQVEIVKEIINKQTIKEESDSISNQLAVYIAVENGNEEILKILLEEGCSVDSCFYDQLSPLHIAATFEHTRLVEMLLKAGVNINVKTKNNVTPLDFAAAAGCSKMVKFLLDAGANVSKDKQDASTPLEYALNRRACNENEANLTPLMFQNLLNITEMLLIAGVCKMKGLYHYKKLLNYAINLRVSSESGQVSSSFNLKEVSNEENLNKNEDNKNKGSRPEIVRCLLNYYKEDKLNDLLNSILIQKDKLHTPDIVDVILEYYDSKSQIKISHLKRDYWSNLHIIGQIEDAESLVNVTKKHNSTEDSNKEEWDDLFKQIIARLVLLPSNEQTERSKSYFFANYSQIVWQSECQEQIKSMKITKLVDELNLTVYDILTIPVDKVASYVRDEKLLNSLESSYKKFPAYAKFLKLCVENGKRRSDLKEMCVKGMFRITEKIYKIQFSSEGIEEILQYLTVIDLRRLSAAFS